MPEDMDTQYEPPKEPHEDAAFQEPPEEELQCEELQGVGRLEDQPQFGGGFFFIEAGFRFGLA